jgi:DNA-binding transcriptional LysR family regulator
MFVRKVLKTNIEESNKTMPIFESVPFKLLREGYMSDRYNAIITLDFDVVNWQNSHKEVLYTSHGLIAYGKKHPLAKKRKVKASDFKNETFMHVSAIESPYAAIRTTKICKSCGFAPKKVAEFPNLDSVFLALENGEGVAVCDKTIMPYNDSYIKLFELDDKEPQLIIVWKKKNETKKLLKIIELIKKAFAE